MNVFWSPAGSQNYAAAGRTWVGGCVIHCTEGYLAGDLQTLRFGASRTSAHDLIAQNGDVYAIVGKQDVAFHVLAFGGDPRVNRTENRPTWLPPYNGRYSAVNAATVGYELSGFTRYGFADAQYRSLARRVAEDSQTWGFRLTYPEDVGNAATVLTHARLQNDRSDPGPLFDWPRFRRYVADELAQLHPEEPMPTPQEQSILAAAARHAIDDGAELDHLMGTRTLLAQQVESLERLKTAAQGERDAWMAEAERWKQLAQNTTAPAVIGIEHVDVVLHDGNTQTFRAAP